MEIFLTEKKEPKLNTLERFNMYDITKKCLRMDEIHADVGGTGH
jgi:hypothetical protein